MKVGLVFFAESGRHASKLAELVGALGARLSVRLWVDRPKGLEIGSGIVESAGKRVVGVRCKQPGMRWSEAGLSAIVDLRAHVLSNRYD